MCFSVSRIVPLGASKYRPFSDVEGMIEILQEQIDLLERQIGGEIVALHR